MSDPLPDPEPLSFFFFPSLLLPEFIRVCVAAEPDCPAAGAAEVYVRPFLEPRRTWRVSNRTDRRRKQRDFLPQSIHGRKWWWVNLRTAIK